MFRQSVHNSILRVLRSLNVALLEDCRVCFGGGTLLTLCYGEYRVSRDLDFLCTYGSDFSRLRRSLYDHGIDALFREEAQRQVRFPADVRTDRDGVRFAVGIDEFTFKLEIVAEGRIALEAPESPAWSPVPCLSRLDRVAEKLLANSDRWADASTDSRDLIDLAVLQFNGVFSTQAIDKAESAYRCVDPLRRAILQFQDSPGYRQRCYERLGIEFPALIIDGLDQLAAAFELPLTQRSAIESSDFGSD